MVTNFINKGTSFVSTTISFLLGQFFSGILFPSLIRPTNPEEERKRIFQN